MLPKDAEHFCTKAMLQIQRFAERYEQPLKNMAKSCPSLRNGNLGLYKAKGKETENVSAKQRGAGGSGVCTPPPPPQAETFCMKIMKTES